MYFITKRTSETGQKFAKVEQKMKGATKRAKEIASELGAHQWRIEVLSLSGGLSSLFLKEQPDLKLYREIRKGEWVPKLTSKKGKEIKALMDSAPVVYPDELNSCIGFKSAFSYIGFNPLNEEFFGFSVKESWGVQIPEDCEEITKKR